MVGNYKKNSKNILLGIIYRYPHEGIQWNELSENQFDKVLECEKEIYLVSKKHLRKHGLNIWNHLALNKLLNLQQESQIIPEH